MCVRKRAVAAVRGVLNVKEHGEHYFSMSRRVSIVSEGVELRCRKSEVSRSVRKLRHLSDSSLLLGDER